MKVETQGTSSEGMTIKEGNYHFCVDSAEERQGTDGKAPTVVVKSNILAGDHPEMVGREQLEFFNLSAAAGYSRLLKFACAVGLYTKEQWEADKAAGRSVDIDFAGAAAGRHFCGRLTHNTHEGKTYARLDFNIWHLNDPEASSIPKDTELLDMLFRGGAGNGASQPAQGNPAQATAPASDDYLAGF